MSVPISSHPLQCIFSFGNSPPDRYEVISYCSFYFYFIDIYWCWEKKIIRLLSMCISLWKCLNFLPISYLSYLFLYCCMSSLSIMDSKLLSGVCGLQIFFQFLMLPFHTEWKGKTFYQGMILTNMFPSGNDEVFID